MENSNIKLERMEEKHLEEVLKIEKECFNKESRKDFLNCISRSEVYSYFVLVNGDRVVGYYGTMNVADDAELLTIAVTKAERRQGYAETMLRSAELGCRVKGGSALFLEVNEKNTPAIELYKKFGFSVISTRAKYYGEDNAIIMRKNL